MSRLNPPPISDTELNAYVDGETFPERQALVEAWLAGHPAEAARVKAWRRQNQVLRATFGRILAEPMPGALARAATPRPNQMNDGAPTLLRPIAGVRPAPTPHPWDRADRLALIAAGSFLAGASFACLAGLLIGWR